MDEAFELLQAAFAEVGGELLHRERRSDDGACASDFILDPGGLEMPITAKRLSLVTADTAEGLVRSREIDAVPNRDTASMLIANRVTEAARPILTRDGWGYLDLRGRLALRVHNRSSATTHDGLAGHLPVALGTPTSDDEEEQRNE